MTNSTTNANAVDRNGDLAIFLGPKNRDYYLRRFEALDGGRMLGWHWPAFFITAPWLLYRKMWAWAVAYIVGLPIVLMGLAVLLFFLVDDEATASTAAVGMYFGVLFFAPPLVANSLYYGHARREIRKINATTTGDERRFQLARAGGTSGLGVFIAVLVISVPVVGVLAAIAIPAYQDYTVRAQVSEGLALSAGPKAAVAEYVAAYQAYPESNLDAGLPADIDGAFVESVNVEDGWIVITYGNQAHEGIQGHQLYLGLDEDAFPELVWFCGSDSIAARWLPSACRE